MTLKKEFTIVSILVILGALIASGFYLYQNKGFVSEVENEWFANEIIQGTFDLNMLAYDYFLHPNERSIEQWQLKNESVKELLQSELFRDPWELSIFKKIKEDHEVIGDLFFKLIQENQKQNFNIISIALSEEIKERLLAEYSVKSQEMGSSASQLMRVVHADVLRTQKRSTYAGQIGLVFMIIVAILYVVRTIRIIITPILKLKKGAEIIGKGDLEYVIDIKRKDEIGDLAVSFNEMKNKLKKKIGELEQANVRMTSIVEQAPFGIFIVNERGGIDYVNPAMLIISGGSKTQFKKLNIFRLPTYKKSGIDKKIRAVLKGKQFEIDEIEYTSHFGKKTTIRNYFGLPVVLDGKPKAMIFIEDITERIKAERALGERMKELRLIYETSKIMEGIADTDKALKELVKIIPLAYQFPEIICAKIIYNGKEYKTKNFKKTKWGQSADINISGKRNGGLEVFYLEEKPFLVEEKAMLKEVASQIENISERKKHEGRLRQSETDLKDAQSVAHVGSWHLDIVNNILTWSDEVYRIFGLKPQEFGGTYEAFLDTIHPDDREFVDKAYTTSLKEKIPYDIEHRIVLPDGKERVVREICKTEFDKKGKPLISTGIVQDITDRKKAEEKVRALDKLKSRFITALTHVTRTPLNRMRWAVESMLSGDFGEMTEEQQTFLRQILDNEGQILRLITNMNIVLDIERDTLVLDKNKTSITSLVKSVMDSFQEECKLKDLECSIVTPRSNYPSLSVDAEKLRKVMELLLDNALRYSKEKGLISVRFSKSKDWITIKIIDKGIGIPKAEQINIFERFFRASNAQSLHPDGVGLGLYIAKAITEAHEGQIGFKSQESKGSEFWVKLPIIGK